MPAPDDRPAAETPKALVWNVRGTSAEVELVIDDDAGDEVDRAVLELQDLLQEMDRDGIDVLLAADHPPHELDPLPEAVADAVGLTERRDLLQMRRPLPLEADHPSRSNAPAVATRPFRPGVDDEAWLRVNNRAFSDHPDQGNEDATTLAARMSESWFDASDFLVADEADDGPAAGELVGFCWTKVHAPVPGGEDALGEIYVIGVDPRHRGEGLGPPLVLAGLDHLASKGIGTAVLYVDATNEPARRLYDRLGFEVHRRRRVYTRPSQ